MVPGLCSVAVFPQGAVSLERIECVEVGSAVCRDAFKALTAPELAYQYRVEISTEDDGGEEDARSLINYR